MFTKGHTYGGRHAAPVTEVTLVRERFALRDTDIKSGSCLGDDAVQYVYTPRNVRHNALRHTTTRKVCSGCGEIF